MTMSSAPSSAAFFMKAATGWLTVGLAPMTMITSVKQLMTGAVTAPDPIVSKRAATDEAWQSRVQ